MKLRVLILVVMEDGLVLCNVCLTDWGNSVLILVVMEDGLVLALTDNDNILLVVVLILVVMEDGLVLWLPDISESVWIVLILVVMEDGLVRLKGMRNLEKARQVLILVVMEDGLVHLNLWIWISESLCLNPCCNGRWSRTTDKSFKGFAQVVS